ncbi:MAG: hypothetical protein II837_04480 [Treponema sp.]|nr:hypothetical protein [Treponema sp.]
MAVQDKTWILDWISEPFSSEFHGFIGSPEYDAYIGSLDVDATYAGFLKEEALERKEILSRLRSEVGDAGVAILENPGGGHSAVVLFDKRGDDDRYVAFTVFDDGRWKEVSMTDSEIAEAACGDREAMYRSAWFGCLVGEMTRAGFPLSSSDKSRISHFATFVDKLPEYREMMAEGPYPVLLKKRDLAAQDYEEMISSRAKGIDALGSQNERRMFSPAVKARYYERMAKKDPVEFVRLRYAEKSDYWERVAKGKEVPLELKARCAPGHEWTASDHFINVRHKCDIIDQERFPREWENLNRHLKMWRSAAEEEMEIDYPHRLKTEELAC